MHILEFMKEHLVLLDGGMGTLLQAKGLAAGELPERWNLAYPERITEVHRAYFDAGSHIVSTNTFGANTLHYTSAELEEIIPAAVENARRAQRETVGTQPTFVALDIGPTGRLLSPFGDLDFEDAVSIFATTVEIGVRAGVDLILIETMNDSYETKAALLAAKEHSTLPVFVSNAYGEDGKLMTGATPSVMAAMLEGLGADAIGVNCSRGPAALLPIATELVARTSRPIFLKPNAGLPHIENGRTVYDVSPEAFAECVKLAVGNGVRAVGGCCGTTPEYIRALSQAVGAMTPLPIEKKSESVVTSYASSVSFGKTPVLIGERINPTGKKRFRQALIEHDIDYVLREAFRQETNGAHVLDVNVGTPEVDEASLLCEITRELQAVCALPLQLDTADPVAMERALRVYNGKALINSVNGKKESMEQIFPLAKKYGGVVVALTLDENGIPETAQGRVEIARRILEAAAEYGIDKKDLLFDPLTLTVSADANAARVTLEAVERIRNELGCNTSLGVSNVSFGLPRREMLNSTFFSMALERGLSAAILNPDSQDMMRAYYAFCALSGSDAQCASYIAFAEKCPMPSNTTAVATESKEAVPTDGGSELQNAIRKGRCESAKKEAKRLLESVSPTDLIAHWIVPALDAVGKGFEEKRVYLPQLLMSAEAAKAAFEEVKCALLKDGSHAKARGLSVVIATVKGDIHDIGKNIVRLLLENYGFEVLDLGKDVEPARILDAARERSASLVCLSALMTTTLPAMEETVRLLHDALPQCKVAVGGAVLNGEYAHRMGADFYSADAMGAVRYAESLSGTERGK